MMFFDLIFVLHFMGGIRLPVSHPHLPEYQIRPVVCGATCRE